jgi:peptidoglycan/LPS O-acetylase OafA/YrhL
VTDGGDPARSIVRALIAALCGAAFLLIVVILSGERLDDTSGKAIATAMAFAIFSLTGMAGISLHIRPQPAASIFGAAVAIVSVAAFLSGTFALWTEPDGDGWELPGILFVLALGGGHAALLTKGIRDDDADGVRAIRGGVLLTIAVICLLAISEISSNGGDVDPRTFGVLAVLYLLGTVLLPLVRRNSPSDHSPPEPPAMPPTPVSAPGRPVAVPELLCANGHLVVEGPVARGGVHGSGQNVCMRDPDGKLVEVIVYDEG